MNGIVPDPYAELHRVPEAERITRLNVRCAYCAKLLAEMLTSPWQIRCRGCKAVNRSAGQTTSVPMPD